MTNCPNCNHPISEDDDICPNCGFNLKKYRDDFFTDQHKKAKYEKASDAGKIANRMAYRREFFPERQNTTVQKMITWIRSNATIVFLLGILLLVFMSFSRSLGWISFLLLLVWLFIVCDRAEKVEQYTVDRRLTEKINQIGSNMFNSVADRHEKIRSRNKRFEEKHGHISKRGEKAKDKRRGLHYSYIQLSIVLTAFVSLIVLFSGSGASVMDTLYTERMSISRVLLNLGSRLLSAGNTSAYGILVYLIWLFLILFPIIIIYNVFKDTKKSQLLAFILSLLETVFLIYLIFRMSTVERANTGILKHVTSQLMNYAISVGASTYLLILASALTTGLCAYNLLRKDHSSVPK